VRPAGIILLTASFAITGCGESRATESDVRVDSLPGGIPRTISAHPVDSGHWHLVRARDIQPPENDSAELANPQDLGVADDGTVFVVDARPTTIKVFSADGQLARTIGRDGSGPGEFRVAYIAVLGDTLVAQDARNSRATSFNWRTGIMLSERRTACCYFFPIGIDGSGRAVIRAMTQSPDSTLPNVQAFVRFPVNSALADTVFVPGGGRAGVSRPWVIREGGRTRMSVVVPFQPRAFHAIDRSGGFVTGFSSEYILRRSTTGRDTSVLFGREWSPSPVSPAEKSRIVEQRIAEVRADNFGDIAESTIRASFDPSYIPESRPAFEGLWVDAAGRTWVRLVNSDAATVQFDLFDADGRWLDVLSVAAADWPRSTWSPVAFGNHEVAVPLEGRDGRPLVRVFRIDRR
jgi:hypothetical protein